MRFQPIHAIVVAQVLVRQTLESEDHHQPRLQARSAKSKFHSRSKYLAMLDSPGNALTILSFFSTTTDDTTELCGVENSTSSLCTRVESSSLLLLLTELPLESLLPPNQSVTDLSEMKEGLGWTKNVLVSLQQIRL